MPPFQVDVIGGQLQVLPTIAWFCQAALVLLAEGLAKANVKSTFA